ncbi:MAG: GNAT family N-acetyltransferase [Candidatus Eremiobacteraeota bacterium]|nr:GNAT family N-acetyltransferase [Candidatus Eremiobacteraeota bacterium]
MPETVNEHAVTLRRATAEDAPVLASHRAAIRREHARWDAATIDVAIPVWQRYFRRTIADETYVAYIAERDREVVGSGALLIHHAVPRPGSDAELDARMHSVYVVPDCRRRGIGRAIVDALLGYARARPVLRVVLHPSEEARPLYASFGFEPSEEMVLAITGLH